MTENISFGPDKSQLLRAFAIILIIAHHNHILPELAIGSRIFTFLVGYGYAFAKSKDVRHAIKRIWHLLSHFWFVLFGLFLPAAVLSHQYSPTLPNVLANMFGLDGNLNNYSWYIYFYIFAMFIMIPCSRIITRYRILGCAALIVVFYGIIFSIHLIPDWGDNPWLFALHNCLYLSPVMFVGFYLSEHKVVIGTKIEKNMKTAVCALGVMILAYVCRAIPGFYHIDFVIAPVFSVATVVLFNIIDFPRLTRTLIAIGKESMNMWFLHALFFTATTATVFAPLVMWIDIRLLRVLVMVVITYFSARLLTLLYNKLF